MIRCAGPAAKVVEATFDATGTAQVSIKLPRAGTYAVTGVVGAATSFEHSLVVCSGVISKLKVSFDIALPEDDEFGFLEEVRTDCVAGDALPSIMRVERQGALVEIDVALRDVRGLADDAAAYRALLAAAPEVEAPAPAQALFSPVLSPPVLEEAPVPANAPAPAEEEEEDLDVLEAVSILVEKGKRSRRVLGPDHPLTVEVLGQLEQALSPTSPFSPSSLAPAPAPPLTVDDV